MQEIVPPKLNKDTGMFSLLFNRRNFLLFLGLGGTFLIWSTPILGVVDYKIFVTLVLSFMLLPFLFDVSGRPLHIYISHRIKFLLSKKEQRVILGKDISGGIIILADNQFAKVFRIEPINLSMSSGEEIMVFKQYMQTALFSLKNSIQILSIQKYAIQDSALTTEIQRYKNLKGKLRNQCEKYLLEYQQLKNTMERSFYLVLTTYARGLDDAKRKLEEEENSFGKLLEQTKIRLAGLDTHEILEIYEYLLHQPNHVSN